MGYIELAPLPVGSAVEVLLPGDFDLDGTVDQADYDIWRSSYGATGAAGLAGDGNGDGSFDAADYSVWRDNLGASLPSELTQAREGAVADEPNSAPLAEEPAMSVLSEAGIASPLATIAKVSTEATVPPKPRPDLLSLPQASALTTSATGPSRSRQNFTPSLRTELQRDELLNLLLLHDPVILHRALVADLVGPFSDTEDSLEEAFATYDGTLASLPELLEVE